MYDSSSVSNKHYDCHQYHPYQKSDKEYLQDEFKKENPSTLDVEVKKSKDPEAWLLGMKNFFRLHDYSENMKTTLATFILKSKEKIWWEDGKNVRGIREECLTWNEFEWLFKKEYLSERYFDEKEK